MQPAELHPHVTDVVNQDTMPYLAGAKKQFATNVEKWFIYRRSAGANKVNLHTRKPQKPINNI